MISQPQVIQPAIHMTADEFLALPESNLPIELINGEVIMAPAPIPEHQRVVFRSAMTIDKAKPNGEVFISPIDVYLDEKNIPQPDVIWISENSPCKLSADKKRFEGAPDLIVEVISASSGLRDRRDKFNLYEKYGVREYWIVDLAGRYMEVWQLENRRFLRQGIYGPEDKFQSAVLGAATIELSAIFA